MLWYEYLKISKLSTQVICVTSTNIFRFFSASYWIETETNYHTYEPYLEIKISLIDALVGVCKVECWF